ncbi:MAG: CPBP family intramembrane glutamic endopeptidase [Bacteroidia bacterium]
MAENQEPEAFEEIPKPRIWYFLQFISLILMAMIGGGLFGLLAIQTCSFLFGIDGLEALSRTADMSQRNVLYALRYILIMQTLGTFVFSSVIQLVFMREPLVEGLGVRQKITPIMAALSILLVIFMQPAVGYIAEWSLGWKFPEALADLEAQVRKLHEDTVSQQFAFLKDQTPLDLLFNLFMMALLPAFAEELFFRRVGLRLLYDSTGNVHMSIGISALLFALVHGQFFYLIPLFLFGIVLGYLAYWSRSLWLPVIAHFINNAFTLTITYFTGDNAEDPSVMEADLGNPLIGFALSVLLSSLILLLLKRRQVMEMETNDHE